MYCSIDLIYWLAALEQPLRRFIATLSRELEPIAWPAPIAIKPAPHRGGPGSPGTSVGRNGRALLPVQASSWVTRPWQVGGGAQGLVPGTSWHLF